MQQIRGDNARQSDDPSCRLLGARSQSQTFGQAQQAAAVHAGQTSRRNYSLSDAPHQRWYRISVKREPGGAVSKWLHDHVQAGAFVHLQRPPAGELTPDDEAERPLLLETGAWASRRPWRCSKPRPPAAGS